MSRNFSNFRDRDNSDSDTSSFNSIVRSREELLASRLVQCRSSRSNNNSNRNPSRCCKNALRESLDLLLSPFFKNIIDLTSFTLIGENFATRENDTTIKSISTCGDNNINFQDDSDFTITTICDLIAIKFRLLPVRGTRSGSSSSDDCDEELNNLITRIVQRNIPKIDSRENCCVEERGCTCNRAKASFLANSIGPVNIRLDTSVRNLDEFLNVRVITVTNNIAWFFTEDNSILIVCLNSIVSLG